MTEQDRQKLEDIHACLVGNKIKGQRGLIDRVEICENEIHTIKSKKRFDWLKIFKFIKIIKPV